MPPVVIPNSAQVRLGWTIAGQGGVNVLGAIVQGTTTIDQTLANTLGAAIKSAFTTNLATHYATATVLVRVGIRDIRTANQVEYRDTGATVAGTGTGDPLPAQVAHCVTLRTARAGRSFRGRCYLPGPSEAATDTFGNASTAFVTAATAFVAAIQTAFASNGLQLAVLSKSEVARTITKEIKARAAQATPVSAIESRAVSFETQRRRNNQRGGAVTLFNPPQALWDIQGQSMTGLAVGNGSEPESEGSTSRRR